MHMPRVRRSGWGRAVGLVLLCALMVTLVPRVEAAPRNCNPDVGDPRCAPQSDQDLAAPGQITEVPFKFDDPEFKDALTTFPDFTKVSDDFLPGDRENLPVVLKKATLSIDCSNPLAQLLRPNPTCAGTTTLITAWMFTSGRPQLTVVPFNNPPKKDDSSGKRLARQVFKFIFSVSTVSVLYDCVWAEGETKCKAVLHNIQYGDNALNAAWTTMARMAGGERARITAEHIASVGGTAIVLKVGIRQIRVFEPGAMTDQGNRTFAVRYRSDVMDAAAVFNSKQSRVYVPLRFVAQAIGATVTSQECDETGNCRMIPTVRFVDTVARYPIGQDYYTVNGTRHQTPNTFTYLDPETSRTMVSARYAVEPFGYLAVWIPETQEVIICKGGGCT